MKYIVIFGILISSFKIYGQSTVTIKTPRNVSISADEYITEADQTNIDFWESEAADWLNEHSSNAEKVAPASQRYNCHGWAFHMKDGGDTVWINAQDDLNDDIENLENYWSGSTPTYITTTASEATVAFYGSCWYYDTVEAEWKNPCDHSVQMITQFVYESKWGAWGRYQHAPSDCPYDDSNITYYKIPLNGPDELCTTTSGVYSTHDITGASYDWGGSNVNVSGSSYSVSATRDTGGAGYITVDISSPFSGTTVEAKQNFTPLDLPATPQDIYIEMDAPPNRFTASIVNPPGGLEYNWYKDAVLQNQSNIDVVICTRSSPYCDNEYYMQAEAVNTCGVSFKKSKLAVEPSCGYFISYHPNPSEEHIYIAATDEFSGKTIQSKSVDFTVNLYDSQNQLVVTGRSKDNELLLRLEDTPKGIYYLHINDNTRLIKEKIIVE